MTAPHHLDDRPAHLFRGHFDAATPPVLEIASGDEVVIDCLPACDAADLPDDGRGVLPSHAAALEAFVADPHDAPHVMTGPVAVAGATAGDVLEVEILSAGLRQDWGVTMMIPGLGALPGEVDGPHRVHSALDVEAGTCRLPWGQSLPLAPFFGVLATAPPAAWGRLGSAEPRAFGGNMDCRELVAGATVWLPVFEEGALFSAGDGHALQGDGEVCVSAVETALTGRFRLGVRRDMALDAPLAATATHWIALGFDADLDEAARKALRAMLDLVERRSGLSRADAMVLLSLAGQLRVTQVVDGEKGVHVMLAREDLPEAG